MKVQRYNNQINKFLLIASVILLLIAFSLASNSFSRYTAAKDGDYNITSASFYFSSDIITEEGGNSSFNGSFHFELYNFSGENYTEFVIEYNIAISDIVSSGNTTIGVSDDNPGELTGGAQSTSTITITPHADIISFTITVSTTNGYAKTLSRDFEKSGDFAGGIGSESEPYQISDWYHLNNVRNDLSAHYELIEDLDSTTSGYTELVSSDANEGKGWEPIGYDPNNLRINRFTGHFNGQGYTITDLYINRPNEDNIGLFGHIGISENNQLTTIGNICLLDVDIIGKRGTGALVGRVTGNQGTTISYACVTGGTVTGTGATGGLVGSNNSYRENMGSVDLNPRILFSYSHVSVTGVPETGTGARTFEKIGGLAGCSQKGTIEDSYSHSSVTINNDDSTTVIRVGGLAGCNEYRGEIRRSYSTGAVSVNHGTQVGGFLGRVSTQTGHTPISNCYWDTVTSGWEDGDGIGNDVSDTGITPLTTAQMQGTAAETNMSALNFTLVWQSVTGDYPILR